MSCDCENPGYFNSGFKGILAHVAGGKIKSKVERCDVCAIYPSDQDAKRALVQKLDRRDPHKKDDMYEQEKFLGQIERPGDDNHEHEQKPDFDQRHCRITTWFWNEEAGCEACKLQKEDVVTAYDEKKPCPFFKKVNG